jgi:hypothetical protein
MQANEFWRYCPRGAGQSGAIMKHYTLSFADAMTHIPDAPERTARRNSTGLNFDVTFQVWPGSHCLTVSAAHWGSVRSADC